MPPMHGHEAPRPHHLARRRTAAAAEAQTGDEAVGLLDELGVRPQHQPAQLQHLGANRVAVELDVRVMPDVEHGGEPRVAQPLAQVRHAAGDGRQIELPAAQLVDLDLSLVEHAPGADGQMRRRRAVRPAHVGQEAATARALALLLGEQRSRERVAHDARAKPRAAQQGCAGVVERAIDSDPGAAAVVRLEQVGKLEDVDALAHRREVEEVAPAEKPRRLALGCLHE
eukprot:2098789-Prymnesium_polylepis.1